MAPNAKLAPFSLVKPISCQLMSLLVVKKNTRKYTMDLKAISNPENFALNCFQKAFHIAPKRHIIIVMISS